MFGFIILGLEGLYTHPAVTLFFFCVAVAIFCTTTINAWRVPLRYAIPTILLCAIIMNLPAGAPSSQVDFITTGLRSILTKSAPEPEPEPKLIGFLEWFGTVTGLSKPNRQVVETCDAQCQFWEWMQGTRNLFLMLSFGFVLYSWMCHGILTLIPEMLEKQLIVTVTKLLNDLGDLRAPIIAVSDRVGLVETKLDTVNDNFQEHVQNCDTSKAEAIGRISAIESKSSELSKAMSFMSTESATRLVAIEGDMQELSNDHSSKLDLLS